MRVRVRVRVRVGLEGKEGRRPRGCRLTLTLTLTLTCMASLLPAWLPPLRMLKAGTGRYILSVGLPASTAMCLYSGRRLAAAPSEG